MKKFLLLFLGLGLFAVSCSDKDDEVVVTGPEIPDSSELIVQDFMWKSMNLWYFWQDNVDNLSDTKFANTQDGLNNYLTFLNSEANPTDFLKNKILFDADRFTYFSEDYKELTQSFEGISQSNGLEFGLGIISGTENVFGYVRYIIPNSNAATTTITRGDFFTGVDGQTLNLSNYVDLLFGDNSTYTLNMADYSDNTLTSTTEEITLTKEANFVENPVFLTKVITKSDKKIGYVVYNGFTANFDEELNSAFGDLKAQGITDLVLDLRYNPGGSVNSSIALSSMIYNTDTSKLFSKTIYNPKITQAYVDAGYDLNNYFTNSTSGGNAINTLNLNKVYVIALYSSASASELVINGLAPYIDVIHVGDTTRGKNEFSTTLVDDPDFNYTYRDTREGNINSNNSWAIQAIIGKSSNADDFSDYTSGLIPDIVLEEKIGNLGILGDENEPLLARALQEITGVSSKRDFSQGIPIHEISNSKMFTPLKDNMYVTGLKNIK
ncbi:carboxyl-terminal protease [Cellulophaga sp. HaHa_2_95]|uniref:S41 family peptidase n=1 Tax=unclassified Cellulophaga TaxID=2634405 RepID=UPI001C5013C8|nr:S41 family peptidase [Cellulophaga sp. HaHa_2_95]QXP57876.1 carboxyl-terminal protease [Cellulophaga sp. HaHa_2_95]